MTLATSRRALLAARTRISRDARRDRKQANLADCSESQSTQIHWAQMDVCANDSALLRLPRPCIQACKRGDVPTVHVLVLRLVKVLHSGARQMQQPGLNQRTPGQKRLSTGLDDSTYLSVARA